MKTKHLILTALIILLSATMNMYSTPLEKDEIESKIDRLMARMTLEEKIGQMCQRNGASGNEEGVRKGRIGSLLNEVSTEQINKLQRIAVGESRLGIPLIIGRDVIHGYRTIFPIPLGLAATWNPDLVQQGARVAAVEAASTGIRWTFGPMIDVSRDARWGRIAESFGEDHYLTAEMAVAMVKGFQTDDLTRPDALAACAKHYVGYGAAEGGRDYNTTCIPEELMRDVYLKPFQASVSAGVATLMSGFHEINGVPATGNVFLLKNVLRDEWKFDGFVVSDWASVTQMIDHGFCADEKDAALKAITAGLDMEMATTAYEHHLKQLLAEGKIGMDFIDTAVRNILRIKFRLGLFENPYTDPAKFPAISNPGNLDLARKTARQSIVLLKNDARVLPLSRDMKHVAVLGPLADDPFEQLGTWAFDKNLDDSVTPLHALREFVGTTAEIHYVKALDYSRSRKTHEFAIAAEAAKKSDVVLIFAGEEAILSGEAHCRAEINLPGAQEKLIEEMDKIGKPIVLVIMAGRPLTIGSILDNVDAVLYAFHPGTMSGPAIVDLLYGIESPSGKLPVTFPKMVGQIPIYYNHKNTGRPARAESWVHIDSISSRPWQTSLGNESHYLDAGFTPLFPFGFGLSYARFEYSDLKLSSQRYKLGEKIIVSARIKNSGDVEADEVAQLYVRDLVGDRTRPVKELKGFQRVHLKAGEEKTVTFELTTDQLAFCNQKMELATEPGDFHIWIASDSDTGLMGKFEILP
ncbi:MAG: beta-glucosidase BglX [Candidatus Zhuqueibacterota bacterium]